LRRCGCGRDHTEEIEESEREVLDHLEASMALAPTFRPAYARMFEFHMAADRPREAALAYERLLEHRPEDAEALRFLIQHYNRREQPENGLRYAERLQRQKLVDRDVAPLIWSSHVVAARLHAKAGRFEQADQALTSAEAAWAETAGRYDMLARRALLEMRRQNDRAGKEYVEQAIETLPEATLVWLFMAIEATRYGLAESLSDLYEHRWHKALKRRCNPATAAGMCELMQIHLGMAEPYARIDDHVESLLKYVRRCTRVRWNRQAVRSVCHFLDHVEEYATFRKIVKRGVRSFPNDPWMQLFAAEGEITKGPFRADRKSISIHLNRAAKLARESKDPEDRQVTERVEKIHALLDSNSVPSPFDGDSYFDDEFEEDYGAAAVPPPDVLREELKAIPPEILLNLVEGLCERMDLDLSPEEALEILKANLGGESAKGHRKRRS
jgi:Tfp pilus assembly protein PilF